MKVKDLMTKRPITVGPDLPVLDARYLMMSERIRHLIVMDGAALVGIVTDRDIRLSLPAHAPSLSVWEMAYLLARLTVGQVMSRTVIQVDPAREAREAARLLLDHKIGALPVVDDGYVIGILTESDFVRAFVENAAIAALPR